MSLPPELQEEVDDARAIVRYGFPWWLRLILLRGVAGITLGRRIYLGSGANVERSLRHELVHVRQIAHVGVVKFYWRWVSEYLANRRRGMSSDEAYRSISFEAEAFASETYNRPRVG